jgi:hypothetical protein
MSDAPEQATSKPSNSWDRLFILWLGVGFLLVTLSTVGGYTCPARPGGYPTFLTVGKEAEYEAYDGRVALLTVLAQGALANGLLGTLGFFRRGCVVFLIAGVVIVICGFVLLDATWVDL